MSVSTGTPSPITQLLAAAGNGDTGAQNQLWTTVYDELHRLAHAQLRAERGGNGLQTTLLVHEAYLRLVGDVPVDWHSRGHFFSAAANAMRRIRVDYARSRRSLKRGGPGSVGVPPATGSVGVPPVPEGSMGVSPATGSVGVSPAMGSVGVSPGMRGAGVSPANEPAVFDQDPAELLALDEALERLAQESPRSAQVVMLRYFAGLSIDEVASVLGVSPRTVDLDWQFARSWLYRALSGEEQSTDVTDLHR